jgi:hypothetical protein
MASLAATFGFRVEKKPNCKVHENDTFIARVDLISKACCVYNQWNHL